MIVIVMALIGAVLGGMTAKKRSGTRADIAQYAAGYGIAFALAGMVLTLLIDRFLF